MEHLSRPRVRVGRCRGSCTTRCWENSAAICRPLDVRTVGSCVRGSTSLRRRRLARQSAGRCWTRRSFRSRPSLERILEAVADRFGYEPPPWTAGRGSDDASRAAAAYLARRRFGYPAKSVAAALGYRDASGVSRAIHRIEAGTDDLLRSLARLERSLD